ncbi:MAG: hypothetical protein LBG21_03920 [Campylobacteraceae bacterium]|nr:hypothetical protein [Campylobacteraceae bacterium]
MKNDLETVSGSIYMYSKKVFSILVALFVLTVSACFGLNGFGNLEVDLKYVNEEKHFPEFKEQADEIHHIITRFYSPKNDYKHDEKNFKNKYQNKLKRLFIGFKVNNPNPQIQAIKEISLTPSDAHATYYIVISDDTLDRNDELFQNVFGYEKGTLSNVIVVKNFPKDITDKLKKYSELLKTKGFKKSEITPNTWIKKDSRGKTTHMWNFYNAGGKSTASWTIGN